MNDTCTQAKSQPAAQKEYWPMVNFRLPPEDQKQLEIYARSRRIGVSAAIRLALVDAGVIKPSQVQA